MIGDDGDCWNGASQQVQKNCDLFTTEFHSEKCQRVLSVLRLASSPSSECCTPGQCILFDT